MALPRRLRADGLVELLRRPLDPGSKAPKLLVPQDRPLERAPVRFGQVARVAGPGALPPDEPVGPQQVVAAGLAVIERGGRERDGALGLVVGGAAGGHEEARPQHGHPRRGGRGVGEQLRVPRPEGLEETPEGRQRPGLRVRPPGEQVVEDEVRTRHHLRQRLEDVSLDEAPAQPGTRARAPASGVEEARGSAVAQVGEVVPVGEGEPQGVEIVLEADDLEGADGTERGRLLVAANGGHRVGPGPEPHVPEHERRGVRRILGGTEPQSLGEPGLLDVETLGLHHGRRPRVHDLARGRRAGCSRTPRGPRAPRTRRGPSGPGRPRPGRRCSGCRGRAPPAARRLSS